MVGQCAGESSAASESRSAVALKPLLSAKEEEQQEEEEEEEESSRVFGTYKHRFIPKAIFAFLHLLPIFSFPEYNIVESKNAKTIIRLLGSEEFCRAQILKVLDSS